MNNLIQNAIRLKSTGEILVSRYRHHFVKGSTGTYIDGGLDYARWGGAIDDIEDFCLNDSDTIETKVEKALWGISGKDGKSRFKWVFLKDCKKDHLHAILERWPGASPWIIEVINEVLGRNSTKEVYIAGYERGDIACGFGIIETAEDSYENWIKEKNNG